MSVSTKLTAEQLACLRCPETQQTLQYAETKIVDALNQAMRAGTLQNKINQPITRTLDGGLVRSDGQVLYPIIDHIPILIIDEAIILKGH